MFVCSDVAQNRLKVVQNDKKYYTDFLELRGGAPPRLHAHRATLALPGRVYILYLKRIPSGNI